MYKWTERNNMLLNGLKFEHLEWHPETKFILLLRNSYAYWNQRTSKRPWSHTGHQYDVQPTHPRSNPKSEEHKCVDLSNLQIKKGRIDAYFMEIFGNPTLRLLLTTLVTLETSSNSTNGRSPEINSTWHLIFTPLELLAKAERTKAVQSGKKKRTISNHLHSERYWRQCS